MEIPINEHGMMGVGRVFRGYLALIFHIGYSALSYR
jgi:hypothetical protein